MRENITSLICAMIFAIGLCVSGMINPSVVIGFLDVTGPWNPALMFVMIGALAVTTVAFKLILKRSAPTCGSAFHVPTKNQIDKPLVIGAVLFGIGWGLVGICPGPAIASLALLNPKAIVFVVAMLIGSGLYQLRQ